MIYATKYTHKEEYNKNNNTNAAQIHKAVSMGGADFTTLYAYLPGLRQRVETTMRQRAARTATTRDRPGRSA